MRRCVSVAGALAMAGCRSSRVFAAGSLERLFAVVVFVAGCVAVLAGTAPGSAAHRTKQAAAGPPSEQTYGQLNAVAVTAAGVLAVGQQRNPLCGNPISELGSSAGWQIVVPPKPRGCGTLNAVASDGRGGAWAVGDYLATNGLQRTLVEHFDGRSWAIVRSPSPGRQASLGGVVLGRNQQVWAVGAYQAAASGIRVGAVKTLTMVDSGAGWRIVPSPSPSTADNELNAVTVAANGALWAVGDEFDANDLLQHTLTLRRSAAAGWGVVASPSPATTSAAGTKLISVTAAARGTLWAVGQYIDTSFRQQTLALRYDGSSWQIVPSPSLGKSDSLEAAATAPDGSIWAVGEYVDSRCAKTLTERYRGTSWQLVPGANPLCTKTRGNALHGLAVDRRGVLYAVGDTGIYTLVETNSGSGWHAVKATKTILPS